MVGPRIYEVEEVDELVPDLESIFSHVDGLREKLRTLHIRVNALELIWGESVHQAGNADHDELQHHLAEMKSIQEEFEGTTRRIGELGGQLKGLDPPLVDFYGVREGHLILWCWTRGEKRCKHWHHVDEGFAGRQPV